MSATELPWTEMHPTGWWDITVPAYLGETRDDYVEQARLLSRRRAPDVGTIKLGLNLEFARLENQGFDWAMDRAAEIGYKYVEPMVHWGRELLSAAGYFHSRSMLDDPLILKKAADERGLKISSLSSHAPLAKPDVAVEYLRQSIRYAVEVGAPMIMVDDGPTPDLDHRR